MKPDRSDVKPNYWDKAKRSLARRDPVMGAIMRRHRGVHMTARGEPFMTLARAICGQQISVKAAQSVWNRLSDRLGTASPETVGRARKPTLRSCGLSGQKAGYLKDLAGKFRDGTLDVAGWHALEDEVLIAELMQVKGIGRWTAEMFLMFNLLRPDVFPLGDLGLQKGIRLAYYNDRKTSLKKMKKLGETWRPWRSVATWYLWRSLDPVPVEY